MAWYNQAGRQVQARNQLGQKQQNKFQNIKQNQGQQAARQFRQGVMQKKGFSNQAPQQQQQQQTVAPQQETAVAQPVAEQPQAQAQTFQSTQDFRPTNDQYRSVQSFGPQSAEEVQSNPAYQWRIQQAQKTLGDRQAAQGSFGSGQALQEDVGLTNEITGQEWDRQMELAGSNASNYYGNLARQDALASGDAARYDNQVMDELNRGEGASDRQWGRVTDMLNYYNQQNPMQYNMQGVSGYANNATQYGNAMAPYIQDNYSRYSGGGGGYTPMPYYMPSAPQADHSVADMIESMGNY